MTGPGFVFWGLFAVFGVIVLAYLIWMFRTERRAPSPTADPPGDGEREEIG